MTAVEHVMEDVVCPVEVSRVSPGESGVPADPAQAITAALHERLGEERFDLWFDRKTRLTVAGNALVVEAPNPFAAQRIRSKFHDDLVEAGREVLGRALEVTVRVSEVEPAECGAAPAPARPAAPRAGMGHGTGSAAINRHYVLEEFVVGPSNQLAYHAAVRVAERPGQQFNPLFLHGHCGLGKTHLLQGICQRFAKLHPGKKWLYLTGEQFTNEYLEAIRMHKTDAFRRRIRSAELLVIDDVHFLANKRATQEEFLHTFNQVDASGRQVVLASDCAPRDIRALSEQLSSRFVSGMVLRVDSPDLPTRLEILRRRAARNGWAVSEAVLMHIAKSATSSVRELEGMLLQAMAGISLIDAGRAGALASADGVEREGSSLGAVLASLRDRMNVNGPISVQRIIGVVAAHFSLKPEALCGMCREKTVTAARGLAMYLARQHTGMSYPEIARAMGNKNHSTVIGACQRVEAMVAGAQVLCWTTPEGAKHQAVTDVLHDLEAAVRRAR